VVRGHVQSMTPKPSSSQLQSVRVPHEPAVQAERMSFDHFGERAEGCYRMRAPVFAMPRASGGDNCVSTSAGPDAFMQQVAGADHGPLPCRPEGDTCSDVLSSCETVSITPLAAVPEVGDELSGVGGILAEKYYLSVCLGDRIPLETGAAKVNSSRLETGPQWREFLRLGLQGELCDGIPLDMSLQCPCCLGMLRRPLGLPCGHSLCRACFMRLPASAMTGGVRRCPLCRADIPRGVHISVNEHLDAVSEALHAFSTKRKRHKSRREGHEESLPGVPPMPPRPEVFTCS